MSEVTTIQLFSVAETDNAANIDMPDDGVILAVMISAQLDNTSGDADGVAFEVSFGSASAFITNDARSVIAFADWKGSLSGVAASFAKSIAESYTDLRPGVKVFGGERIFLHVLPTGGGLNTRCRALLICQFSKFTARRR